MRHLIRRIATFFHRLAGRKLARTGLTEIEYEAVSLIAYEGRAAAARAQEQAEYCRGRGSASGETFWREVAVEVERRAGVQTRARQ
jgi:hypothetical protein